MKDIVMPIMALVLAILALILALDSECVEPGTGIGREVETEVENPVKSVENAPAAPEEAENDATKFLNRPFVESEWMAVTATAYCPCADCCGEWAWNRPVDENGEPIVYGASGVVLTPGVSVAADWDVYPAGTVLEVYGMGAFVVEDCGVSTGGVDFYMTSHEEAVEFGIRTVYVRKITK